MLVVQTVDVGEAVVQYSNTVASSAELIMPYRCPNTSCVGLQEELALVQPSSHRIQRIFLRHR